MGVTRAKQRAYLVRAFHRHLLGSSKANPPSRFLQDIPPHLVTLSEQAEESSWTAATAPVFRALLKSGDRVHHADFGDGIVVRCSPLRDDQEVTVAFAGVGVKRLLLSLAPLERLA